MPNERELPRYKCHKEVWALKIKFIEPTTYGLLITPEESGYDSFTVNLDYVNKHNPKVGGYYVVYDDGHKSWSPAKAFEDGYTKL